MQSAQKKRAGSGVKFMAPISGGGYSSVCQLYIVVCIRVSITICILHVQRLRPHLGIIPVALDGLE